MKIYIKAKPNSYEDKVEKVDETHFIVSVKEPPQNGLANKGICRTIAKYLGVAQSTVVVKKGFTSKNKVVEIL